MGVIIRYLLIMVTIAISLTSVECTVTGLATFYDPPYVREYIYMQQFYSIGTSHGILSFIVVPNPHPPHKTNNRISFRFDEENITSIRRGRWWHC